MKTNATTSVPTPAYHRPIYATLYYLGAFLVGFCTLFTLIMIAAHPDDYRQTPFGPTGAAAGALIVGGGLAIVLWGTGQIFNLLGLIEFNTRRPAPDLTLSYLEQIAQNTRPLPPPNPDDADPAYYYYREKDGTEKGPFRRAQLRTLLAAGRITPATRIDPELNGTREADLPLSDILA